MVGGIAAAVVVAVVVGVVALSGGGDKGSTTTATPTTPTPDLQVTERVDLVALGSQVFAADPAGRILRMEGDPLAVAGETIDAAGPRGVAISSQGLHVVDADAVTLYQLPSMAPVAATAFTGGVGLASEPGGTIAAIRANGASGRVCVAGGTTLGPCADLSFAPTGVGVSGTSVLVVNGAAGQVLPFTVSADALTPSAPIAAAPGPRGRVVAHEGRLYVAVERGIAVLDPVAGSTVATIATGATPSDLLVSSAGKIFAAVPGAKSVLVANPAELDGEPLSVSTGTETVALAASASGPVLALSRSDGVITGLDPSTAEIRGTTSPIGTGGAKVPAATLNRVAGAKSGRRITITLSIARGALGSSSIRVTDRKVTDGGLAFELWQGGIATGVTAKTVQGVRVGVTPRAGRLAVGLTAEDGRFLSATVRRTSGGRAVEVVLVEKPPPPPPPPPPSPSPSPSPSPGPSPSPSPSPPPPVIIEG